ncbi:twisted gastrulation protein homolog 1-A-like [Paramacrobiotus metropolitanus]|uniref:twisted gastrulation protein homolog 1-A-like n=1 Tax=Paramacrobiotus metropolitanus TaxID=2943436 RepID=UPI0024464E9F|nr:twisted gastrulation protein homolog 1-A-like [Paramacrobiotus metropolitanus]
MRVIFWLMLISGISLISLITFSSSCKEALCASVVSKCLLIDACKCDIINCTCCKACFQCLDTLFADCCECVDMCPKAVSAPSNLSSTSHVEDLPDPLVELFNALTEEHDATGRWTTYTYPVQRDLSLFLGASQLQQVELGVVSRDSTSPWAAVNCTVAFMAQCMPWNKCKNSCRSMGASSYRWFHDGCCQCVGSNCLNYGMNETRCLNCPRMSGSGMDEEYEIPDDDDRPRKHTDATEEASQEIWDRSHNTPPFPIPTTAKPKAKPIPARSPAKTVAPNRPGQNTARPAMPRTAG